MPRDLRMLPTPSSVLDTARLTLDKLPAEHRFELRLAIRAAYAAGYDDGHRDGYREARDDAFAEREQAKAADATDQ